MALETGITLYFRDNRIHIRRKTIWDLENPSYVHLYINEKEKQMFIQSCDRDKDAFRVYYSKKEQDDTESAVRFYINAKRLLEYLAKVIGVSGRESLWYSGELLEDEKTVYINLVDYRVIPYGSDDA